MTLDLDAIRGRVEAATPGPWDGTQLPAKTVVQWMADWAFIDAARTDVPALLAEVERLRAFVERIRDEHTPDPERSWASGYDRELPGGYGVIDPACQTCNGGDEYAVRWPCETHAAARRALGEAR